MPEITCLECNDPHDVIGPCNYSIIKATGEIIAVDGDLVVADINFKDHEVEKKNGPIVYCPKVGKHLAIGSQEISAKVDELADEIIRF